MEDLVELLAAAVGHHPDGPQGQRFDRHVSMAPIVAAARPGPHHKPTLNFRAAYREDSRRTAASSSRERRPSLR